MVPSDPRVLTLRSLGLASVNPLGPHLHVPTEGGAGVGLTLPKSTLGPLGFQVREQGWHMNRQTSALKAAGKKHMSFLV